MRARIIVFEKSLTGQTVCVLKCQNCGEDVKDIPLRLFDHGDEGKLHIVLPKGP